MRRSAWVSNVAIDGLELRLFHLKDSYKCKLNIAVVGAQYIGTLIIISLHLTQPNEYYSIRNIKNRTFVLKNQLKTL